MHEMSYFLPRKFRACPKGLITGPADGRTDVQTNDVAIKHEYKRVLKRGVFSLRFKFIGRAITITSITTIFFMKKWLGFGEMLWWRRQRLGTQMPIWRIFYFFVCVKRQRKRLTFVLMLGPTLYTLMSKTQENKWDSFCKRPPCC